MERNVLDFLRGFLGFLKEAFTALPWPLLLGGFFLIMALLALLSLAVG